MKLANEGSPVWKRPFFEAGKGDTSVLSKMWTHIDIYICYYISEHIIEVEMHSENHDS